MTVADEGERFTPSHARGMVAGMTRLPLGSYAQFAAHAGPVGWGPDEHAGTVSYGSAVIPNLVAGLRTLAAAPSSSGPRRHEFPAVLGCVGWLGSRDVVEALALFKGCCVVIDKGPRGYAAQARLMTAGTPISSIYLPGFEEFGPPDSHGRPPVIGPYGSMPEPVDLGPLRAAGWASERQGESRPLVHAKMLVAGTATWTETDSYGEINTFKPVATWFGSANWTAAAEHHLEFGIWTREPQLLEANLGFLRDLISFSERLDTVEDAPTPELVKAEWAPDSEFRQALAESEYEDLEDYGWF